MPTVKINISNGLRPSILSGIEVSDKMHNFTVGVDGSLYKLPMLKNLKNTETIKVNGSNDASNPILRYFPAKILDFEKIQSGQFKEDVSEFWGKRLSIFKRYIYLTLISYGTLNVDYTGKRVPDEEVEQEQ